MLQPGGENSIIIVGGANTAAWSCAGAQRAAVEGTGMLLLQRELTDDTNAKFAQVARDAGVPVLLDAGGAEGDVSTGLLECVSLLSPNETELARLSGMPTSTDAEVRAAARELQRRGGCDVLVKLGAKGSVLFTGAPCHWGRHGTPQRAIKAAPDAVPQCSCVSRRGGRTAACAIKGHATHERTSVRKTRKSVHKTKHDIMPA